MDYPLSPTVYLRHLPIINLPLDHSARSAPSRCEADIGCGSWLPAFEVGTHDRDLAIEFLVFTRQLEGPIRTAQADGLRGFVTNADGPTRFVLARRQGVGFSSLRTPDPVELGWP